MPFYRKRSKLLISPFILTFPAQTEATPTLQSSMKTMENHRYHAPSLLNKRLKPRVSSKVIIPPTRS